MPESGPLDGSLAARLLQALKAEGDELFLCLTDRSDEVLANLLKNPALSEEHLLTLLQRRDLPETLLQQIYSRFGESGSRRLKIGLARNPATPAPTVQAILPHLFLFELLDLCLLPGASPDLRLAAERRIGLQLHEVPLGNKLSLARRAPPGLLALLVKEGEPQVLSICLDNPRLPEASLHQLLRSGRATPEVISLIARNPRWGKLPRLRQSILKSQRTPAIWFTLWLPKTPLGELKGLALKRTLGPAQRQAVEDELKRRGLK